ncbi:MAG TPA: RHS repeat-associated core domain-containing protein [Fimbriimonadaceae bacterium]|nr:RHS repeat-associated core domain-containing protein [Fimbriimonadaceae bacterium]
MPLSVVNMVVNGKIAAEQRGATWTEFVSDPLGSVTACRNSVGIVTHTAEYWPYGEMRTQTGTNPSPWAFCGTWGYRQDPGGQMYVRARYHRPTLGRWQTIDPIWPWESAFGYVSGSPVRFQDPTGMMKFVGCDDSFVEKIKRLCARIKELTPKQVNKISKCIARTSKASNQTCQPFNADRLKCFKKFCDSGLVECLNLGTDFGNCPNYAGANDRLGSPTSKVQINQSYGSSNFSNESGGGEGIWSGRLTFLHEVAHACGVDHGKYGGPSECQCNDIYACCMFEVLMGRNGDYCVDAMKKYIGEGNPC